MKLELSGGLQKIYDEVVLFHVKHSRGPSVGEVCRAVEIPTGRVSHLLVALAEIGLVTRDEVKKPSGYMAIEITPTEADPYDEAPQ